MTNNQPVASKQPTCGGIVVVPDLRDGVLTDHDLDVFGAARLVADRKGMTVTAFAFDPEPDQDWGAVGADYVMAYNRCWQGYDPEADSSVLADVMDQIAPASFFLPDIIPGTGDVARRLSASRRYDVVTSVHTVLPTDLFSTVDGGRHNIRSDLADIVLLSPECALQVNNRTVRADHRAPFPREERKARKESPVTDHGLIEQDMTSLPLPLSDFIIAAGNGVTDWAGFHKLAKRLNATIGGTRVVCDNGLLAKSRQVGSSGNLVKARCYLAFGIAGAPQHLQGISKCRHVIAVNTDLHADMIKRADIAIVADAQAIIPALLNHLKKAE